MLKFILLLLTLIFEGQGLTRNEENVKEVVSHSSNSTQPVIATQSTEVNSFQNITDKIKDFIMNGQTDKSEALKIKWSNAFLDRVDIEGLYKQYIVSGGKANDLESFANYLTKNAPIPNDWEELFKKDLLESYGEKVIRIEGLNDDLYQAYIELDGSEVPYVVVSSRTGYFHG